ncbi:MAG: carbon storage regulator CsrA [Helicobacteraceae bacterium]|nr:carbon storage regulator CsrA [Helicobacteraceae bacterium]
MLILARKEEESIVISDNIIIKVISVEKGVVKLGIDAPREISILRSELIQAVQESNKEASNMRVDASVLGDFAGILKKK